MLSKSEELKMFDEFVKTTEEDGYLRSMFGSPYLRAWVADQIQMDHGVSLADELKIRDNAIVSAQTTVKQLQDQLAAKEKAVNELMDALARQNRTNDDLRKQRETMTNEYETRVNHLEARAYEIEVKYNKLTDALLVVGHALRGK